MILVLAITTVLLYYLISREVQAVFDTALLDKANALIALTELDAEDGLEFDFSEGMMPEFEDESGAQYYQLWENGVDLLLKSPSLGEGNLPLIKTATETPQFADIDLADGRKGRLIAIRFLPRLELEDEAEEAVVKSKIPIPQPITMVIARERASLDEMLFSIAITISSAMVLVLLIIAYMMRRLIDSGLSPLSSLAQQVSQIDQLKLDQRLIPEGKQSIEIAPIENQINHLLERLQSAFEREKRFSSNVAHELRTPLAELRTLAEVGKMVPEDRNETLAFFTDVADISRQMETVVITLLELARSDAGLLSSEPEDIVLSQYCDHIWLQAVNGGGEGKILMNTVPDDLVIHTDKEKLGMILSNLFTNAVSYSPAEAEIHVKIAIAGGKVAIQVRNTALDLKPEDIIHMKDRFWRKHTARTAFGHSGLGLSLVDALARIMKLKVSLQLDEQRDFLVTISGLSTV